MKSKEVTTNKDIKSVNIKDKIPLKLNLNNVEQLHAFKFANELCKHSGKDDFFLAEFWNDLIESPDIYNEFYYYLTHGDYYCQKKIHGYTVIDIMIWQMDRFKADLDQNRDDMKQNGDLMLLMAFTTFLKMEKNPDPYINALQNDTGTDYPGKY